LLGTKKRSSNDYVIIKYKYQRFFEHRLVWFYKTGTWPKLVDHKDGNKSNNKFENLREATHQQNSQNSRNVRNTVSSRVPGVSWCTAKQKYKVTLIKNGKYTHGGFFTDLLAAEKRSHEMRLMNYDFYVPENYFDNLEEING
jgi:hypothetical protein